MTEFMSERNGTIPISSRKMVRFTPNMPVEVALQSTDGVRIEGRYGDRVKYTLTDDRTMYVDPLVAERIRELDVQPGEVFKVCKCQAKKGNRKTIYWLVQRDGEFDTQLERDLHASLKRTLNPKPTPLTAPNPDPSPPTATGAPEPPPSVSYNLETSPPNNGSLHYQHGSNGARQTPASAAPPLAKEAVPHVPSTQLAHALKTAISAAADAEKFAKTLDYNIRFTTDDIRSMGITVLIGMQQRMPR